MAVCDQGYLCDVCGQDVEAIIDSDLYLRYILGEVHPLALPTQRERHIRCNPATAQYIVDQSGRVVFHHDGEGQYEQIDRTIARLLNVNS